ncbi:MAG TPA: hypothetical protein VIJ01_19670 [Candidatus Angelobacter sp.]
MEAAFSNQHSAVSERQNQAPHQNQKSLTTEDTESTEINKMSPQQQASALAIKLARTYEELTRLLERNPAMKRGITEGTTKEDRVYQKLKQRLKMADMAPRCQWVRQDGTSCRSPQMKQHIYCFAHRQMAEARTLMLMLPAAEDANAIQVGLMRIQKAVIEDTISMKKAGLLLYSMQLAMTNVGQTTFGQAKDEEMVRETVDEEEAFSEKAVSSQQSAFSQDQIQNQTFETQRNGGSGGAEALPRIHGEPGQVYADEGGSETETRPVEWKPSPDMYRMDTQEGREACEASFRRSSERRPVQAVITPEDPAQVHNSALRDERLPKGARSANESLDADRGPGSVLLTETYANLG